MVLFEKKLGFLIYCANLLKKSTVIRKCERPNYEEHAAATVAYTDACFVRLPAAIRRRPGSGRRIAPLLRQQ